MIISPAALRRSLLLAACAGLLPAGIAAATLDNRSTGALFGDDPAKADRLQQTSIAALKAGLEALSSGNIEGARTMRDAMPSLSLDRHILTWAVALKGGKLVPSSDIASAARDLPGWPGMDVLRRNSERALFREAPDAATVVKTFGTTTPQTAQGVIILARAQVALGNFDAARAVLSPLWRNEKLDAADEIAILKEFGTIIPAADHRFRMERMLYADRLGSAKRVADLAGARDLYAAWSAVARADKSAAKLLDAVPATQRSAGYLFAKAKLLRRDENFAAAAAIMLNAPKNQETLVDPDAWWIERRVLSRELVDQGDMKSAYQVVAAHSAESPVNQADAEFHAGWYALRGLNDPILGAQHFARIAEAAQGPVSLSRAYYWMGRAAQAGGPGDAKALYTQASAYGTTFYGQLAAQKIGAVSIDVTDPMISDADRSNFAKREAVAAIKRLERAGAATVADTLYRDLAAQLDSPGELALLAGMAEARGNHYLALKVGKAALSRGIAIGALSHPMGVIPDSASIPGSGRALAYAIARQESEFNVSAVSGAGAQGLLQLMPGTAKDVARKAGIAYLPQKLTTDAGYNATLGAAFLGEQLGRFGGSYVLTFAGYNAGPNRAQQWIDRYGDPRGKNLDVVVDWIERIPYAETRSYVQRVMENYQVYKMRLTGSFDIKSDLVGGRLTRS